MSDEELKRALLAQAGLTAGRLSDERRKEIEVMIASDKKRLRFMRRVMATLWIAFAFLYVFWMVSGAERHKFDSTLLSVLFVLTILFGQLAAISSVLLFLRARAAGQREIRMRLELIESELRRLNQTPSSS